jgi:peptidyl-prolyl cis-trans isomerase B (cyclophilin B)
MSPTTAAVILFSILFPTKGWFAPDQPMMIRVDSPQRITLLLTDFTGKLLDSAISSDVNPNQTVDAKKIFPELTKPGAYVLYAVPLGNLEASKFVGTPLAITVRQDNRREAPPDAIVARVEPLCYAVIDTDKGKMTCAFFYDAAPHTVENFLTLSKEGFYDGLTFFRVVPGMLIQTGDPLGNGTGGPGYMIESEFNDRQHSEGVMSMARELDPIEKQGAMPRAEAANSAGSQFFVCLDYENTKQLDQRYTAFGVVVDGLDVMHAIGAEAASGTSNDAPKTPTVIKEINVLPVTLQENPYVQMMSFAHPIPLPTTLPSTLP